MSALGPGATIGILGAGQLGRMTALAARALGYRIAVLADGPDDPAAAVADIVIQGGLGAVDAARELGRICDVVTLEVEHVALAAAAAAADGAPLRPGLRALTIAQDRGLEKAFVRDAGVPTAPFRIVRSAAEARAAQADVGPAVVLKTTREGYDGKGQRRAASGDEAAVAFEVLTGGAPGGGVGGAEDRAAGGGASGAGGGEQGRAEGRAAGGGVSGAAGGGQVGAAGGGAGAGEVVVEALVDLDHELSVIVARGLDGATTAYGPLRNDHANHILDVTVHPGVADDSPLGPRAVEIAARLAIGLDVVGLLCVEFFVTRAGELLVNEMAPRPHNSGHVTMDACATSQFEQVVRAICGLPLGAVTWRSPVAMANLLGDLWLPAEPAWPRALSLPDVHLHLYGKHHPRPGRKMGHLTALAATPSEAAALARQARANLTP